MAYQRLRLRATDIPMVFDGYSPFIHHHYQARMLCADYVRLYEELEEAAEYTMYVPVNHFLILGINYQTIDHLTNESGQTIHT